MTNFFNRYNNKRVALVGSGPQLKGKLYGKFIDQHDEIIRINAHRANNADTGYSTTLRFIGATFNLTDWASLDHHWFPCQDWLQDNILTTSKNAAVFKAMGKNAHFYESATPMKCLGLLSNITGIELESLFGIDKPPTSGTVALIILLAYSKPAEVNLFGYSTKLTEQSYERYSNGTSFNYKKENVDLCHMERRTEYWIRSELLRAFDAIVTSH